MSIVASNGGAFKSSVSSGEHEPILGVFDPFVRIVGEGDEGEAGPPKPSRSCNGMTPRATALKLCQKGFHPVAIHPGAKRPLGTAWGTDFPSEDKLRRRFDANPGAGVGLCLGPAKITARGFTTHNWLIDVEGDGPRSEESFLALAGGEAIETMGWTSARGRHRLLAADLKFLDVLRAAGAVEGKGAGSGVYHLAAFPDLEFRVGGLKESGEVKQVQSVCPPTPGDDGKPREWTGGWDVAEVPDGMIAVLESLGERAAIRDESDPPPQAGEPSPQQLVDKLFSGSAGPPPNAGIGNLEAALKATPPKVASVAPDPFVATATGGKSRRESYFETAVEDELTKLRQTAEGKRNFALNNAACAIGNIIAAGGIDEAEALARLTEAALACGLEPRETQYTIQSGFARGKQELRKLPADILAAEAEDARQAKPQAATPAVDYQALSDADLGIRPLTDVEERPIAWLWPYRLARGEMALVAGEGGLGKSQVLLKIAAILSTGAEWPDGSGKAPVGRTVILAAEDSPATTIKPRLMAMRADVSKIIVIQAPRIIRKPGTAPVVSPVSLQNLPYWQAVFDRLTDVRLLIVDPLPSYLGRGVNDSKNNELREAVEPFIEQVIRPRDVSMLANTHLNKGGDSKSPIHRVIGSVAYANLARNVHFVVRDPDDPSHRVFKQEKCNNAPHDLPAIGFRIEPRTVPGKDGDIETAIPIFDPETMQIDLHEALNAERKGGRTNGKRGFPAVKATELASFLVNFMRGKGPLYLGAIADAAGAAGFLGENVIETDTGKSRWKGFSAIYRGRDTVPTLADPLDGWEIASSKEDASLRGINNTTRWALRRQNFDS